MANVEVLAMMTADRAAAFTPWSKFGHVALYDRARNGYPAVSTSAGAATLRTPAIANVYVPLPATKSLTLRSTSRGCRAAGTRRRCEPIFAGARCARSDARFQRFDATKSEAPRRLRVTTRSRRWADVRRPAIPESLNFR